MKKVKLYTDGCSLGNPGRGGAGAVLVYGDVEKDLMEHLPNTTNNRAELQAIIMGLSVLKYPCNVQVFSDSQITVKCASGEYSRNSNLDLWQLYDDVSGQHVISLKWIRKDSHGLNNRAHKLANKAAKQKAA